MRFYEGVPIRILRPDPVPTRPCIKVKRRRGLKGKGGLSSREMDEALVRAKKSIGVRRIWR